MTWKCRVRGFAWFVALFLVASAPVRAQMFEDRTEPADLGIVDIDSLVVPASRYVGNAVCRSCHARAYETWLGTKHARSTVFLDTNVARKIAKEEKITAASPIRSGICLSCHGTACNVPAAYREAGVHITEGVTCEKCHGPGQAHAEAMGSLSGKLWAAIRMVFRRGAHAVDPEVERGVDLVLPTKEGCMVCHKTRKSHEDIEKKPFEFAAAWKKVACDK